MLKHSALFPLFPVLPVMVWAGLGEIACQTLAYILLSNALAWWRSRASLVLFSNDAFNMRKLSGCSTGPSSSLARAKSTLPPFQVNAALAVRNPANLAALDRFPDKRLIAVGKFEPNVNDHLSMVYTLRFRVPQRNTNNIILVNL